jgi:ferredoxin--NADP+ reductase
MSTASDPSIAIIGSGPSGCYTAQFLRKRFANAAITIFDRLPMPYGLVRFGVAPDHPGTKAVTQQFDRLFERDGVSFIGNTEVGKDISLQEIRSRFDIVVLATGLSADRRLNILGESLQGVYGSGRVTRLINGHPDETPHGIELGKSLVIVGQGNVAIDLIRLCLTDTEELIGVGVDKDVAGLIASGKLERIDVVGRSGIENAKFDVAMIKELSKIPNVLFTSDVTVEGELDSESQKRVDAIESLVTNSPSTASREVRFHFGWSPLQIIGDKKVDKIVFESKDNHQDLHLEADAIFTAIGFTESELASIKRDAHTSSFTNLERGYLDDGLYCVGWLRRGPQGTIPANRADAKLVSDAIIQDFESKLKSEGAGQL